MLKKTGFCLFCIYLVLFVLYLFGFVCFVFIWFCLFCIYLVLFVLYLFGFVCFVFIWFCLFCIYLVLFVFYLFGFVCVVFIWFCLCCIYLVLFVLYLFGFVCLIFVVVFIRTRVGDPRRPWSLRASCRTWSCFVNRWLLRISNVRQKAVSYPDFLSFLRRHENSSPGPNELSLCILVSWPRRNRSLTLSLPRVINSKFPLKPHQKYNITQCEELDFSYISL